MNYHEFTNYFPRMEVSEFEKLKADIEKNGLLNPIWTFSNGSGAEIIDGRHREKCCRELGITPTYVEYTGKDPEGFVFSQNLMRRDLSSKDRLGLQGLAVKLAVLKAKGLRGGSGSNQHRKRANASSEAFPQSQSIQQVAAETGISKTAIGRTKRVEKYGTPDLIAAVHAGTVTPYQADKMLKDGESAEMQDHVAAGNGRKAPPPRPPRVRDDKITLSMAKINLKQARKEIAALQEIWRDYRNKVALLKRDLAACEAARKDDTAPAS